MEDVALTSDEKMLFRLWEVGSKKKEFYENSFTNGAGSQLDLISRIKKFKNENNPFL